MTRQIIRYYLRHFPPILIGSFCAIAHAVISLRIPVVIRESLDHLHEDLVYKCITIVALAFLSGIFLFLQRRLIIGASRWIEYHLRNDFFDHLLRLPARQHRSWQVGNLMALATNDLDAVRMMLGPAYMYTVSTLAVFAIALIQMIAIDGRLTLLALAPLPIIALVTRSFGLKIHATFRDIQNQYARMSACLQEDFIHIRQIKSYAQEEAFEKRFSRENNLYYQKNRKLIRLMAFFYPALRFFIALSFIILLAYGGILLHRGTITFGQFTEFHVYVARLVWPMIAIGWVINLIQRGLASMKRMDEVFSQKPHIPPAITLDGDMEPFTLRVKNLSYGPLKHLSFSLKAQEWLGLVGMTGSGKTLLLKLLARVEEPPEGTIFFNDRDIRTIPLDQWHRWIAFVPQESILFSATLKENLAFSKPHAEEAEISRVVRMAGLQQDLPQFLHGLDTLVGEKGVTLSGGQKQRVALGRAFLKDPHLLLLDDCLASVDGDTEAQILEGLKSQKGFLSLVMASHRMKIFPWMDKIIVLDQGKIQAQGTHEELLQRSPLYLKLWELQRMEEELQHLAG